MVRGGRDMRVWIATAFGLIHGFWFANGLREMDLPARAFRWSLASFDLGVEVAQILTSLRLASVSRRWDGVHLGRPPPGVRQFGGGDRGGHLSLRPTCVFPGGIV
jgi:hypothetical protein